MDDGLMGVENATCETRPRIHMFSMVAVVVVPVDGMQHH